MNPCSLTSRRVALPGGGRALPYPWNGEEVLVRDDAATVLRCIELLQDPDADPDGKGAEFLRLFFADLRDAFAACCYDPRELGRLVESATWDVCGVDLVGDKAHEAPLWDPVEDAGIIRVSLRAEYGLDWDAVRGSMSFAEFVQLVGGCSMKTPLGRAIFYRNPKTKPKPAKKNANRREIEEWERLHGACALKRGRSSRGVGSAEDAAMRDAFAALRKIAR